MCTPGLEPDPAGGGLTGSGPRGWAPAVEWAARERNTHLQCHKGQHRVHGTEMYIHVHVLYTKSCTCTCAYLYMYKYNIMYMYMYIRLLPRNFCQRGKGIYKCI